MALTLLPREYRPEHTGHAERIFPIAVVIYLLLSAIFAGAFLIVSNRSTKLAQAREEKVGEIENLKNIESSKFLIKDRLNALLTITRSPFKETFAKVADLIETDPKLEIVSVSSDDQQVRLSVRGQDSFAIEKFIGELKLSLNVLDFESLSWDRDEKYLLDLIIKIQNEI